MSLVLGPTLHRNLTLFIGLLIQGGLNGKPDRKEIQRMTLPDDGVLCLFRGAWSSPSGIEARVPRTA